MTSKLLVAIQDFVHQNGDVWAVREFGQTGRCGAVRCGAVRCGAVRCGAVWCGVVWVCLCFRR